MLNSAKSIATLLSLSLTLIPFAANAATAQAILDAFHHPSSPKNLSFKNESEGKLDLAKLFDCANLLNPPDEDFRTDVENRLGAAFLRRSDDRIIFSERDVMAEIVFVATNDDFYKLESIVIDKDGSSITVHGYLFKRSEEVSPTEIDLFRSIDNSASPILSQSPADFKKFVKVADLVNNDEFELKIKVESFTAEQVGAFLRVLLARIAS